jgi:hypothetical protein
MNGDNIHCKALDKASVSMAMGERVGLRGYSVLSYAIFSQRRAHGWTFTRKGSIESDPRRDGGPRTTVPGRYRWKQRHPLS